ALGKASPEERKAMANDKKFLARLDSELSGSEKEKALELLKNGKLDTRASLSVAMTGLGTDEDAIYDALKKASPEERQSLMKDSKMMERLRGELSDGEFAKAKELLENGKLSTSTRLDEAMSGMGTDEKGLYSALEDASPEERKKLAADSNFRARLRSELSGSELERAERILEKGPLSAKEKVDYASEGMGTDEDAIFNALRNAGEDERKALQNDEGFRAKLRSELSGSDLERAELLLAKGKTSNVEDLKLAMDGAGTDENTIFSVLGSLKSDEEREKLVEDYRERHGRDLLSDLKSDLSSSEFRKAEASLRTRPKSVDEAMDRVYDDMARDRDGGGWTSVSSGIMDTFTDRGRDLDDQFREMRLVEKEARLAGTKDDPDTLQKINSMGDKFTVQQGDYHEAKQTVAKTANMALSVIAVTALTVATAGAGAPVLVPTLWAAGLGGQSKVLLNKAILGSDYDAAGYDGATGFATGAAEMLATGGAIKVGKVLYEGASLAKGASALKLAEKGAVSGGITGSSMASFKTAISDGTWDRGFGEGLGSMMSNGLWGGLIGAGVGGAFDGAWAATTKGLFGKTANQLETGASISQARRIAVAASKQEGALRKFITGAPKNQVKGEISGALEE
ncbi:MAG: hypothetical protein KC800_18350, partial [Candidatus Eremiobacteraeota bacterium]|nr:hypothetical protein [Candidatus Eremiobacteraeota bacterium]